MREVHEVRREVRRHLREVAAADPGGLVLVACSGGPDSVALADAVAYEAPGSDVRAGALVVDHGLQDGSADVAAGTAEALRGVGLDPVEVIAVEVGRACGVEAAARAARYAALEQAADRLGAATVLLGHTRDDQAETVLLGLARGSGARSLSGMAEVRGIFRRPLLRLPRATVRTAASAGGLPVWDDPHNADPAFARARVRRRALPALEDALGPGVAESLARTAELLRDDADALDDWSGREWQRLAQVAGAGIALPAAELAALPRAVRTRLLRRAALTAGSPASDLSAAHVAQTERLVSAWRGQGPLHLPGGVRVARAYDTLTFSPEGSATI